MENNVLFYSTSFWLYFSIKYIEMILSVFYKISNCSSNLWCLLFSNNSWYIYLSRMKMEVSCIISLFEFNLATTPLRKHQSNLGEKFFSRTYSTSLLSELNMYVSVIKKAESILLPQLQRINWRSWNGRAFVAEQKRFISLFEKWLRCPIIRNDMVCYLDKYQILKSIFQKQRFINNTKK